MISEHRTGDFQLTGLALSAHRNIHEIDQAEATGLKCYRYGFFSRSGVTAAANDKTLFISPEQLYKDP